MNALKNITLGECIEFVEDEQTAYEKTPYRPTTYDRILAYLRAIEELREIIRRNNAAGWGAGCAMAMWQYGVPRLLLTDEEGA